MKDFRFKPGETVTVFRMQMDQAGQISWDYVEDRTLAGSALAGVASAVSALMTAAALSFF